LLYGCETWTIKAKDTRRITAAEMRYMRITAGHTWTDHKANTEIAKELHTTPVLNKIQGYKRNCIHHVYTSSIPHNRLSRIVKNCTTKGRRIQGRPMKGLLDERDRNGSTRAQLHGGFIRMMMMMNS
jgi:hypothetical protein